MVHRRTLSAGHKSGDITQRVVLLGSADIFIRTEVILFYVTTSRICLFSSRTFTVSHRKRLHIQISLSSLRSNPSMISALGFNVSSIWSIIFILYLIYHAYIVYYYICATYARRAVLWSIGMFMQWILLNTWEKPSLLSGKTFHLQFNRNIVGNLSVFINSYAMNSRKYTSRGWRVQCWSNTNISVLTAEITRTDGDLWKKKTNSDEWNKGVNETIFLSVLKWR